MASKILFVGGGSIGHIAPNVAIWQEYTKIDGAATCLFVCANRADEKQFLEQYDLPYITITSPRIRLSFPYTFLASLWQSLKILWQHTPDAVMSKGGYISVPICIITWIMGIPIVLHESDAVRGKANKLVSRWAKKICYGFNSSVNIKKGVYTGNPVRPEIVQGDRQKGLQITQLSGEKPILLVSGGSQGSAAINEAIWQNLPALLTLCDIVHITGTGKNKGVQLVHLRTKGHYYAVEFVTNELADLYAIATIALTRASASTIAELSANGIPMILCPLRGVGHDHQKINADTFAATGGAIAVDQIELSPKIVNIVSTLVTTPDTMSAMTSALNGSDHLTAAQTIAKIVSKEILGANNK